jgi:hypothetical protein
VSGSYSASYWLQSSSSLCLKINDQEMIDRVLSNLLWGQGLRWGVQVFG